MTRRTIDSGVVDELLADLRSELEVEPSSSFAARVRQQVEGMERETRGWHRWSWAIGPAAVAALVVAIAAIPDSPADRFAPPAPRAAPAHDAGSPGALPSASVLPPPVVPVPHVERRAVVSASRPEADPAPVADQPSAFDPFTDVVIPPDHRRGLAALVATLDRAAALDDDRTTAEILRAFEPRESDVRVMALNDPGSVVVAPVRVVPLADVPAGMPR